MKLLTLRTAFAEGFLGYCRPQSISLFGQLPTVNLRMTFSVSKEAILWFVSKTKEWLLYEKMITG
jgi:hypothetical protein